MKILYLLQDFPYPLTNGVRVKVFNLISYVAKRHECHILSFSDEDLHSRVREFSLKVPGVKFLNYFPICSGFRLHLDRLIHFLRGDPMFLARWNDKTFAGSVREVLRATRYDVVHFDALGMAPYVNLVTSTPTVISTTDAVSLAYRYAAEACHSFPSKAYLVFVSKSIARFERRMLPLFSKVHVVSKHQRDYLSAHVPGADIEYIEHVVPDEVLRYENAPSCSLQAQKRILFTGSLSAESIARGLFTFLSAAYPVIRQNCPCVELTILGRNAPAKIRNKIINIPGIRILEWVEDYYAELMKAQVVIFPDWSGTGVKTRVLYALGLGKAVVATPVALEGIDVCDGEHCFERKVGHGFAEAVISLLNEPKLRKEMAQSARRLMSDRYTMEIIGSKWVRLYESAISKNVDQATCNS